MGVEIDQWDWRTVNNALWNCYQAKDGGWVILVMPQTDRFWPSFCQAAGRPDLAQDPRFDSHVKRIQERQTLISLVSQIIAAKTADEWEQIGQQYGLVLGKTFSPLDVINDAQAWENDFFAETDHPVAGRVRLLQSPIKLSNTPASVRCCAPQLGQHTEEVLQELGYAWGDMAEFKKRGVIP